MPATQSGRIVKSRKGKAPSTPHQKNHRWESFSTKISKLHSLDPLRRVRRHDLDAEDLESTTSYLNNGLQRWADLNVGKGFTLFKRELQPLCDSLPQILHFQSRIMDLLDKYISAHDPESLEPLLDLLTAFAHDLGPRFEKHYPRALALIIGVASRPQDVAVVEWTFTCLAFLFKYLSKLLVPDLRPTYDALAPLLGKARNPPHIARFAAEALSFLVKKAATPANRENSLVPFIEHIRQDFASSRDEKHLELYYHGLMTMFAEAVKGQGRGIHTSGPDIIKALVSSVSNDECVAMEPINWSELVCGVLVSSVHHTTAETFQPIPQAVVDVITNDSGRTEYPPRNIFYIRCLGTISGVRKGSRISDWKPILASILQCLGPLSKSAENLQGVDSTIIWQHLMVNMAIVWQSAPMDVTLSHITEFMTAMTREPLMNWFIPFCAYFSSPSLDYQQRSRNQDLFRSIFLKHFQKFVVAHWSDASNEDMLCVFIPQMMESRSLPAATEPDAFSLPQRWQDQIVSKFERLEISPFPEQSASGGYDKDPKTWRDKCLPKYSALLRLLEYTNVRPSTMSPIADLLLRKLKLALRPSQSPLTEEACFIVTQGFSAYLRMTKVIGQLDNSLSPLLKAATPRYSRLTGFLEAMLNYENLCGERSPQSQSERSNGSETEAVDPLLQSLINNLSMPSHSHRLAALRLLSKLDSASDNLNHDSSTLALMLEIEETPIDLKSVRAYSMHMRNLAAAYPNLSETTWLRDAIPQFLFGLMTVQLTPIWDSAVDALKQIGQTQSGEHVICDIAFKWMENPSKRWEGPSVHTKATSRTGQTDFECTNLSGLHSRAEDTENVITNAPDLMLETFEKGQNVVQETPVNARSQSLKVFLAAPALAEKKSRKLVPIFLSWVLSPEEDDAQDELTGADRSWSLFDKKTLIGVFAQFANPKVLYQSQQVYEALLVLLGNGDIEIQKSALKAILAWKQDGIRPYQENLEYLLDEARFKNELTVLFQGDHQIQSEHRAEVMPVLLRLLYGRSISKKGASSGRQGLHSTRLMVLRHLTVEDMGAFLDISLGNLRDVKVIDNATIREEVFQQDLLAPRKQVGFLNMMESMIRELGSSAVEYIDKLLPAILYCLVSSCRKLLTAPDDEDDSTIQHASLLRVIRTTSLKCVVLLLQNAPKANWTSYRELLVREAISPRLDKLPIENTEGISGTLQLLSTFSQLPETALFFTVDGRILSILMSLVAFAKSKDEVRIFALNIVRNLVKLAQLPAAENEYNELLAEELLGPNIDTILETIGSLLKTETDVSKDVLLTCVEIVVELSPMVQQSFHVASLVEISVFLLNETSKRVNPKTKGLILLMLESFLALEGSSFEPALLDQIYTTVASLYGFFRDRKSRETLSNVLAVLLRRESRTDEVALICAAINAFDEKRIGEPDYKKRLATFNKLSSPREVTFTPREWLPLVYNFVFYIKHDEEYGVLSAHSADAMCKFVDAVVASSGEEKDQFYAMLSSIIMPSIYSNAKDLSETVRRETVRVMGYIISQASDWAVVSDLVALDPQPDDKDPDPSFFSNILSPATARQMRALQLLSKVSVHTSLSSRHVSQFLVPLLEHFIFNRPDGVDDQGVGAQAATTISDLAVSLEWPQYRAILRRYISYIDTKPDEQKQVVRLLGKFVDTLTVVSDRNSQDEMDIDVPASSEIHKSHLARTKPSLEKFNEDLLTNVLPPLLDYMHEKDETTVSSRVPVGIIIVKLLKLLPDESLRRKLPGLLTDLCHILRSKAVEARDMTRDTLSKMTLLLGPPYFGFVLKELRGALLHGYQLHVLSYTMHTILVDLIPHSEPGDLDYCLDDIMAIIMDDIFGITGQEKDAEEYTSKTKEIKSSKSQDSMELIARTASVTRFGALISPIRALLLEKLDIKMVRKIDDLLSRITSGLLGNSAAASRDSLVFCYEVIEQVYAAEKTAAEPRMDPRVRRYLVQKGAKRSGERSNTSKYTFKLVRFAIDVLRTLFKKHDNLRNASNISGFIPILGDAVIGGEEEVKIATFKLLNALTKVPFKTDDALKLYKIAAKEASKCVSTSTSFAADLTQASLKLMSVILRDRRDVIVKDAAVDMLLSKLKDDLTEPLYRHITFNFLRSVLDRRVETAVVYDTLDYVGTVMITNDDKDTRDLARGAFFQFLRDYPQKKNRWAKQLSFIVANLNYEREGGRLSVMEVIHHLLTKSADDFVQEIATNTFIPLVLVLANDDSDKCRLAAAELMKEIFRRADKERMSKFLTLGRSWLEQSDNASVLELGIRSFHLYFEAREPSSKDKKDLERLLTALISVLDGYFTFAKEITLLDVVLQTIATLIGRHPAAVFANEELWRLIPIPLAHSDASIQGSSVQLILMYLADFHANNSTIQTQNVVGSHGLNLDASMINHLLVGALSILSPNVVARWTKKQHQRFSGMELFTDIEKGAQELEEGLAADASRLVLMLSKFLEPGTRAAKKDSENDNGDKDDSSDNEDEEEWGGIDSDEHYVKEAEHVTLYTLCTWLSDTLIEETRPKASALLPKVAALDIVSLLINSLPPTSLRPSLFTLLIPLHQLTDPSIPTPFVLDEAFKTRHEGLKTKATETMDTLQRKFGTAEYSKELLAVRERARNRREGRSKKRKIEAVTQPERHGKWKQGRLEKKIKRRKEKGVANKERRGQGKY
ncbi:hypothetical protein F5Y18DRAFT_351367 [Xylariaceae sp. FL1019]|nr:hypothetical protein F5Y18DRAFT_351367 [Xylariaceae sp. FL1019]